MLNMKVLKMGYDKRLDGRAFDEMRPMEAKVGIIPKSMGGSNLKIYGLDIDHDN